MPFLISDNVTYWPAVDAVARDGACGSEPVFGTGLNVTGEAVYEHGFQQFVFGRRQDGRYHRRVARHWRNDRGRLPQPGRKGHHLFAQGEGL